MSDMPLLTAKGLVCARNQQLLFKDFELTLLPGRAIQIVGENGSGKTTLLKALAGLFTPLQGEVKMLTSLCLIEHALGLNPHLSVVENIMYHSQLAGKMSVNSESVLSGFNLTDLKDQYVSELSRGQQQRVALARLQASRSVWLLDEPFTSLDVDSCNLVKALFAKQLDAGGAIVFTSHRDVELSCSDVTLINLS